MFYSNYVNLELGAVTKDVDTPVWLNETLCSGLGDFVDGGDVLGSQVDNFEVGYDSLLVDRLRQRDGVSGNGPGNGDARWRNVVLLCQLDQSRVLQ